jgi:type I restriction enzyme R subunit
MNEAETRAKLIDPAIHARGWTEDLIKREETAGAIEIVDGTPRRRGRGRIDYLLRLKVNPDTQPVAAALIEAKAEDLPPTHGLEQGKSYTGPSRRFNVPFVFSTNGHLFVEYDDFTKRTSDPRPLADFPRPADLRKRYEDGKGFSLADPKALPLLTRYPGGRGNSPLLSGRRHPRRFREDRTGREARPAVARNGRGQDLHRRATPSPYRGCRAVAPRPLPVRPG